MDEAQAVSRYEANYGLSGISVEQVNRHLDLERHLTRRLLDSEPGNRWDVFEQCYDELYAGLPWLADTGGQADVDRWVRLVGRAPQRVYEVGSGAGLLARTLRSHGHAVEATDVSRHRGQRTDETGVRWSVTDGVHLDRYAESAPYDVVVSDQLVEHLHPDDIGTHCAAAHSILKAGGGRYILRTPNALNGPHDVSRIFGFDQPVGMHLHEYTVTELTKILFDSGFDRVDVVVPVTRAGYTVHARPLTAGYVRIERAVSRLSRSSRERVLRLLRGPLYLNVWLIAQRG